MHRVNYGDGMSAIITFIGYHDSGKTTLVSQVVSHLKSFGHRVAVIKSSNESGVSFDNEGTDTFKHRQAGADAVLFVGPDQMVLQTGPSDHSIVTLAHRYFADVDIVIGEGFKFARKVAKIEVRRNKDQDLRQEVHGVIAVATDLDISGDAIFRLNEAREIALFIEKRFIRSRDQRPERASLLVDGRKIPLKDFVQDCLSGTVVGFVDALKLTDDINEIELRIRITGGAQISKTKKD
jgi:molybdopterin-guanine dinucleotide biosynthesis protein B